MGSAPLVRFALMRLRRERHRLLVSNHHLLMDGWSAPVLVRELLTLYAQRGMQRAAAGDALPGLSVLACARRIVLRRWRPGGRRLAGLEEATRVAPRAAGRAAVAPERITLALSETLTAALSEAARGQR